MQIDTRDTHAVAPDLRSYVGLVWRRRWWIVAATLLVGLGAFLNAHRHDERYRASAAVLLAAPPQVGVQLGDRPLSDDAERLISNELQRLNRNELQEEVDELVGRSTDVEATNAGDNDVIRVTSTGRDPEQVAADVNDFLDAYAVVRERELVADLTAARQDVARQKEQHRRQLEQARAGVRTLQQQLAAVPEGPERAALVLALDEEQRRIDPVEATHRQAMEELDQTRHRLDDARSSVDAGLQVIGRAEVPSEPVFPQPKKDLLVGLCTGLLLGIALAFLREYADDRVLSEDALERALPDVPLIATLPEIEGGVPFSRDGGDPVRLMGVEAFRSLAASVEFARLGKPIKAIHVTSAIAGEGKSTTATNLAVAFAETGTHVALLDADLRRPTLHNAFEVQPGPGLADVLEGGADLAEALQPVDRLATLKVLAAGRRPANPARLLYSRRTEDLFDQLRAEFDVVVIDSPPLLPVADSLVLTQFADLVLLVVRSGHTGRRILRRARRNLSRVEVGQVASVLNRVHRRGPDGYDYYYGRYGSEDRETT